MSDSGHPARFGFVQCAHCGTWRPRDATLTFIDGDVFGSQCRDSDWCRGAHFALFATGWDANGSEVLTPEESQRELRVLETGVDANGDAT